MPEAPSSARSDTRQFGRRAFLQSLGGGVLVMLSLETDAIAQESGSGGHHGGGERLPQDVAAWLHIGPGGKITAFTGKVEVGQNIRTSLTQAVADELRCDPKGVQLVMGDTDHTPWDMGTFGSRTTPTMAPQLRRMASTAREKLLDAAAQNWHAGRSTLTVSDACVVNPASQAKISYGELARAIDWAGVIGVDSHVTPAEKWTVAGTSLPKVNAWELVTGRHKYASDHSLPGLLHGRVLRAPSYGATLTSIDTSAAAKMPGVTVVRDKDFVGVVAPDEHLAGKALQSIGAKWQEKPQISEKDLFVQLKAEAGRNRAAARSGSPGAKQFQSSYEVAYIAHVPLEPRTAVAQWAGTKLTVWTGTQRPFGVRTELATAFGVPEEQVRVVMPDTGSAYGGKHSGECAVEAARLAKAAGKPVKLIWTREEEFTWAYFRPAGLIQVSSSVSGDGKLATWDFHNYLSGPSGLEPPYDIPNRNLQFHHVEGPLRDGSYRGLAATANHFARESHIDEIAAAIGKDPLQFRLQNLKNERVRAVLQTAADRFGWANRKSGSGRGYGLACGMEKGGYVACCVEIAISSDRQVRVEHVVEACECGAVVNPEHLKNQVEGAIVMGLGGALFEAIHFDNGRILNPRLSAYRVPRFADVPRIDLIILDRKDLPSAGAGETPIVTIAPAIANAISAATGTRIRSLPILPAFQA